MTVTGGSLVRVSKNALARLGAQVGARLLSLVLVAVVARYESAAGLGRYVLILAVVGLAGAVTDLGLSVFLTREVARQRENVVRAELLCRVLTLKLALSVLGLALLSAIALLGPLSGAPGRLLVIGGLILVPEWILTCSNPASRS